MSHRHLGRRRVRCLILRCSHTTNYTPTSFDEVNHFRWTDEYQAFYVRNFKEGTLVQGSGTPREIKFGAYHDVTLWNMRLKSLIGQTVTIDSSGVVSHAQGRATATGSFTILNKRGTPTHVALKSKINDQWNTVYVSTDEVGNNDTISLRPVNKINVWFQQNIATGTMISSAKVSILRRARLLLAPS